ncbi:SPFH domain, Band 7 family protein [Balnearium lithotrophicum]|uniref:SPFH domain, Band 7 family protein n=1 Tax=Balnearium lithotrophicum TaxID=223788 RepID=A0A521BHI6_9BACT|nr:prohibitin family protein [Balnearium lithotrophicum]SMO46381.1 SPFH domain, Band 7 family protein [Balnearium lithotrophicum]
MRIEEIKPPKSDAPRILILFILIILIGIALFQSVKVIETGEVGVRLRLGKIDREELYPGVHFLIPIIDRVVIFSTRVNKIDFLNAKGNPVTALSVEGLPAKLDITVLYRIIPDKADEIYRNFGTDYAEKIVVPIVRETVRNVVAQYKIEDLYSTNRGKLQKEIYERVKEKLKSSNIDIVDVLLRNVALPKKVVEKIEEKLRAKEEAEKMKYVIEREKLEAQRKITEAKGIAESNRIISDSLSEKYLQWYYLKTLKELASSPNNTFVITPYDQKLIPMLNLNGKTK